MKSYNEFIAESATENGMTNDQKKKVLNDVKDTLESGDDPKGEDEMKSKYKDDDFRGNAENAAAMYKELVDMGPEKVYKKYPDLDWSDDIKEMYGSDEDDSDDKG